MRNPGSEPTVMISGDVMELHHIIYAEREAHAAEVAELHRLIDTIARVVYPESLFSATFPHLGILQKVIALRDENRKLLAAPPTAAAQAVEGMREKFDRLLDEFDAVNTQCEGEILGECPALADAYHEARAALAAWKEATRG